MVSPEQRQAARRLLAGRPGEPNTPKQVAARGAQACERFAHHVSRLLGETGVRTMLKRSVALASAELPWLGGALSNPDHAAALQAVFEQQEPEAITDAFVAILSAFVDLLDRLIGTALVGRLLHEVWPVVFAHAPKDTRE